MRCWRHKHAVLLVLESGWTSFDGLKQEVVVRTGKVFLLWESRTVLGARIQRKGGKQSIKKPWFCGGKIILSPKLGKYLNSMKRLGKITSWPNKSFTVWPYSRALGWRWLHPTSPNDFLLGVKQGWLYLEHVSPKLVRGAVWEGKTHPCIQGVITDFYQSSMWNYCVLIPSNYSQGSGGGGRVKTSVSHPQVYAMKCAPTAAR